MSTDDLPSASIEEQPVVTEESTPVTTDEAEHLCNGQSLTDIDVHVESSASETEADNDGPAADTILIDTIEGSEEEIQKQQIANIYRLLNDQQLINNWTTTDFLEQLKMYGLQPYEEEELESL